MGWWIKLSLLVKIKWWSSIILCLRRLLRICFFNRNTRNDIYWGFSLRSSCICQVGWCFGNLVVEGESGFLFDDAQMFAEKLTSYFSLPKEQRQFPSKSDKQSNAVWCKSLLFKSFKCLLSGDWWLFSGIWSCENQDVWWLCTYLCTKWFWRSAAEDIDQFWWLFFLQNSTSYDAW